MQATERTNKIWSEYYASLQPLYALLLEAAITDHAYHKAQRELAAVRDSQIMKQG